MNARYGLMPPSMGYRHRAESRSALESAGVEFLVENGGGIGGELHDGEEP